MAKLITDHDPYHVHKILGVLVLIHTFYRIGLWVFRGFIFCRIDNEECSTEEVGFDVACNVLHGLLSWSSLLLPLPAKRNFNSPMIWKEFRWHSIIFATRSVVSAIISILALWPSHWASNSAAKLGLIMTTCYAADYATAKFGSPEQRTTNDMPYPQCCTPTIQRGIKYNYALAQFNATLCCVSQSSDLSWGPLIAIQGAPLLMTLVRKGKVSSLSYHRGYIFQLMLPVFLFIPLTALHWNQPACLWNWHCGILCLLGFQVVAYLRMHMRYSKWATWTVGVALVNTALFWEPCQNALFWLHSTPLGIALLGLLVSFVLVGRVVKNFLPIFTLQTYDFKMLDLEECLKDVMSFWKVNIAIGTTKKVE